MPIVDKTLLKQLERADERGGLVDAVFTLVVPGAEKRAPDDSVVRSLAEEVLQRVRRKSAAKEWRFNVFPALNSFVLRARPDDLRQVLEQPEIASAIASVSDEPVELPQPSRPKSRSGAKAGSGGRRRGRGGPKPK